jgi:hypothetical protein
MWICFNDGFVSAVEDWNDKSMLRVRGRKREHLEFLNKPIAENEGTDYKFRCMVPKAEFAELVKQRILNINYGNFKNSVGDPKLHDLYADFWELHYIYQARHYSHGFTG